MYNLLKKQLKILIPNQFLFKNELLFRKLYGVFYKGKNHECTVCNCKTKSFITLNNTDLLCPFCGSLSRNRRLWDLLQKNKALKGTILHFSPSRALYRNLKKAKDITYYSTDFEDEFLADYTFDITNINQEAEKFDIIICYHILEHIIEDQKAIQEMFRVLKPEGSVYIQTPFKPGAVYEDDTIVLPQERLNHFGQADHVRIYSVEGLIQRLKLAGFKTEEKTFTKQETDFYYGFKSPETVLIARK